VSKVILTYILSRTVSKLLQIIGRMCTFDSGVSLFNTLLPAWTHDHEVWPQKTRNIALLCHSKYVSISCSTLA